MTWKEFVDIINKQMLELNIPLDSEIHYIDISHPCDDHDSCLPEVCYDKREGDIAIY